MIQRRSQCLCIACYVHQANLQCWAQGNQRTDQHDVQRTQDWVVRRHHEQQQYRRGPDQHHTDAAIQMAVCIACAQQITQDHAHAKQGQHKRNGAG